MTALLWLCSVALGAPETPDSASRLYVVPSRIEAVAPHVGPYTGLSGRFVDAVDWSSRHGWHATDQGVAVLYSDPTSVPDSKLRSEARVPVNVYGRLLPTPEPGEEGVHLARSEPVLVLGAEHRGPYDTLTATYNRLYRELPGRRLTPVGPTREVYLDDPQLTPPEQLRTEVQIVVEPTGRADVGIYAGHGGYGTGVTAASLAFSSAGMSIRTITAEDINTGRLKKKARTLYMPGGWAEHYVMDIDERGADAIMAFVDQGGGYLGVCAGSFYAAAEIDWGGTTYPYDLDLFPGTPAGPLVEIAPWPSYATTGVTLDSDHWIARDSARSTTTLYYGGPAFPVDDGSEVAVIARFDDNDLPAIVALERGKGRVFLSSVHLEYDLTSESDGTGWPELEKGISDPEADWLLLQRAALWLLGKGGEP
ncbi:MAG: BPL-N domain-containing protein [Myxococcota bacterium]|jgi:glutamine amidotransferase-like uncharacterized protein/DNA gyrase inhibitor GyrI|nr:BPL-N domain-containing protein [Myxococcota bacterium]